MKHSTVPLLPLFEGQIWLPVRDGNVTGLVLFKRHYTYNKKTTAGRNKNRYTGPGEKILLITACGKALFAWRKEKHRKDDQTGINCAIFRNESDHLSSTLIIEAEKFAWEKWPNERLFTFVNPGKVKSSNPGCCFKKAGWKACGVTKARNLLIFEKLPIDESTPRQTQ